MSRKTNAMKMMTYLFAGLVILAAFQAALTVLTYLIIGSIVIGLLTRPWQTIGTLTAVVVLGLVSRYPLPGALLILAVCIVAAMPMPMPMPMASAATSNAE